MADTVIDLIALPGVWHSGEPLTPNARPAVTPASFYPKDGDVHEQVRTLIGSGWAEQLVVRGESRAEVIAAVVDAARQAGRGVKITSTNTKVVGPPGPVGERWLRHEGAEGVTLVLVPPARARWQLGVKRLLDVVLSAALLVLLMPVLLVIAVAIKVNSEGPVLYHWRVLGKNGRPFVGFKFRTMVREADALKPALQHLNERRGPVFKIALDPRVTRLGRWLRKHSLDELPQLWSVLLGDMSLVGPRPAFPSEYSKYELWQMRRLSVVPGLTCLWQLDGRRTMNDFSEWARLDLLYIDSWSLRNDLLILLRTPMAIIKGTGH
jgi:lipopolysaccharide/colanic/teichoic acid biosynthesis glycosyltransferase